MGAVYLARDLGLERSVAVKAVPGAESSGRTGLMAEAWAMAELAHPAVAQIYGIESWRGRTFLIVEFLEGGTLNDRLRRGPVPGTDAVSMTLTLAGALAAPGLSESVIAFAAAVLSAPRDHVLVRHACSPHPGQYGVPAQTLGPAWAATTRMARHPVDYTCQHVQNGLRHRAPESGHEEAAPAVVGVSQRTRWASQVARRS